MSRARSLGGLALALLLTLGAGGLGGLVTAPAVRGWYRTLEFPPFQPPAWLFGPVWTTLYVLMAVAAWRVWRKGGEGARAALIAWGVQLFLNALWSPAFFGLHSPLLGLVVMVALWPAIAVTIGLFARLDAPAAWMLAPYQLWVSFAFVLNASIWWLNR